MFELNENIYCRSSGRSHCQGWASISPRGPSRWGTCSGGRESPGPTGGPDCPAQGLLILCRRCVTLCDGKSDKHQRKGNWCHCFYHQAGQTAPNNAARLTERHYVDKRLNFPRTSLRISCLRPASHKAQADKRPLVAGPRLPSQRPKPAAGGGGENTIQGTFQNTLDNLSKITLNIGLQGKHSAVSQA